MNSQELEERTKKFSVYVIRFIAEYSKNKATDVIMHNF